MKVSFIDTFQSDHGIILIEKDGKIRVNKISPDSEAYQTGIAKDDVIIEINAIPVNSIKHASEILKPEVANVLKISRQTKSFEYTLEKKGSYFMNHELQLEEDASSQAKKYFIKWSRQVIEQLSFSH